MKAGDSEDNEETIREKEATAWGLIRSSSGSRGRSLRWLGHWAERGAFT